MMLDHLCPSCAEHFESVKTYLDAAGIPYQIDPTIVRGP
jgi:histidyl-tRNA synthetase